MIPAILTLNAGSSSFKFSIFSVDGEAPRPLINGHIERMNQDPQMKVRDASGESVLENICSDLGSSLDHEQGLNKIWECVQSCSDDFFVKAVGHRVVHGGEISKAAIAVDDEILTELHKLEPLAPLHQPSNLKTIEILKRLLPDTLQIACFDTAFHQGRDPVTYSIAIPRRYINSGVKRYGFHGISYAYISQQLASPKVDIGNKKTVVAHLGSGCSMAAIQNGKCVNTTMGFSSLAGLPMGTRPGNIDPGVLLYLMREYNMGVDELENVLYRESGLLGLSGISNDLRDLEKSDEPAAKEAVNFFDFSIAESIATMASSLNGLEVLVFTAGVGENNADLRRRVCEQCSWMGITLDTKANESGAEVISASDSRVEVRVIPTNEEFMIASYTAEFLD